MDKPKGDLYKVRRGTKAEAIIHAPPTASGWYKLIIDGEDFHYKKVVYWDEKNKADGKVWSKAQS